MTDLDLSPAATTAPSPRGRKTLWSVVIVLVLAALVIIAVRALGDASLFFLNADEAVEQRDDLGDDRFRLQGTVAADSVETTTDGVAFTVLFADAEVDVLHVGDPPELFQEGIPVVLEGNWEGDVYASDRILVKHSSEYEADNGERLDEAETGG